MTREEILAAAKQYICGDRDQDYGSPETSFNMIAALWRGYIPLVDGGRRSAGAGSIRRI